MKTVVVLGSIFVLAAATPVSHNAWRNGTVGSPERPASIASAQKHVTRDLGIKDSKVSTETIHTTETIDTTWTFDRTLAADGGTTTYTLDVTRTIDTTEAWGLGVPITISAASQPSHAADDPVNYILHPNDCWSSITSDIEGTATASLGSFTAITKGITPATETTIYPWTLVSVTIPATATPSPISRHVKKSSTSESMPSITSEIFSRISAIPTTTSSVTSGRPDISIVQGNMTITIPKASVTSVLDQLAAQATSRIEEIAFEAYSVWNDAALSFLDEASISIDFPFTSLPQAGMLPKPTGASSTIIPIPDPITTSGSVTILPNWPFTSIPQSTSVQARDWLFGTEGPRRPDRESKSPSCSFTDSQCVDCSEDDHAMICNQCNWAYECSDKKSCMYQDGHELVRHCQEKEVACRDERSHYADDEQADDDEQSDDDEHPDDDEHSDDDDDEHSDESDSDSDFDDDGSD